MLVEVTIGGDKFKCEQGKCYSIDLYRYDCDEITHAQYKESTKGMTRLEDWMAGDTSENIVYWWDDNGGVFFVKSNKNKTVSDSNCR